MGSHAMQRNLFNSSRLSHVTITFFFLVSLSSSASLANKRLKREAGFYTTRFGRSDPMMRFEELKTRFAPEVGEASKRLSYTGVPMDTASQILTLEDIKGRPHEPRQCVFSVRRGTFVCRNGESDPWKATYFEYLTHFNRPMMIKHQEAGNICIGITL